MDAIQHRYVLHDFFLWFSCCWIQNIFLFKGTTSKEREYKRDKDTQQFVLASNSEKPKFFNKSNSATSAWDMVAGIKLPESNGLLTCVDPLVVSHHAHANANGGFWTQLPSDNFSCALNKSTITTNMNKNWWLSLLNLVIKIITTPEKAIFKQ